MAGRTVDGAFKTHVAKTAIPPLGNGDDLARDQQLKQHIAGFRVGDDGAHRHFQNDIVARSAKHIAAHAVLSALGFKLAGVTKVHQSIEVGVGYSENMATTTSITTVGTAKLFILFMPERDAAVTTITCGNVDRDFVNKFHK